MSEPVPALMGARFDGFAVIEELAPRGMIALRGDLATAALQKAATEATGADFPEPLRATRNGDDAILWMSPDELLLLCAYDRVPEVLAGLAQSLAGQHHLAVDMSDARSLFRVSGPHLREVLAKLTPADMAPDAFLPGQIRRTRLAQVAAGLWLREAEVAEILCFRSVAQYVFDLLANASAPGSEVGHWV